MFLSAKNITSVKSRIYDIESREKVHLRILPVPKSISFSSPIELYNAIFLFLNASGYKSFPAHEAYQRRVFFFFEKFTTFSEEIGEKKRIARSNISGQITVANNASRRKVLSHCSYWPVACFRVFAVHSVARR